jgi:hypothetical protein
MVYPSDARLSLQGPSIQLISISDASFKDNDTRHKKQEQQRDSDLFEISFRKSDVVPTGW